MPKVLIVYDTKTGKTEKMAFEIAKGIGKVKGIEIFLRKVSEVKPSEVKESQAIIIGSPTHNAEVSREIWKFLKEMEKFDLKDKLGSAFGSYGWSGEAVSHLIGSMQSFGMSIVGFGISVQDVPNESDLAECRKLGEVIAERLQKN